MNSRQRRGIQREYAKKVDSKLLGLRLLGAPELAVDARRRRYTPRDLWLLQHAINLKRKFP